MSKRQFKRSGNHSPVMSKLAHFSDLDVVSGQQELNRKGIDYAAFRIFVTSYVNCEMFVIGCNNCKWLKYNNLNNNMGQGEVCSTINCKKIRLELSFFRKIQEGIGRDEIKSLMFLWFLVHTDVTVITSLLLVRVIDGCLFMYCYRVFNCSFKAHGGIDDNCSVISSINGNDVNSPRTSIFCKAVDFLVNLVEGRKTFSNKLSYCMVSSIPDESSMLAESQDVSVFGMICLLSYVELVASITSVFLCYVFDCVHFFIVVLLAHGGESGSIGHRVISDKTHCPILPDVRYYPTLP
ncbi:hypothetical protein ANN_09170 [Periplaneta americana]|uniref:Uncharacterized protein n=1 Tax=Periplaneta americana TaxID=6978 RepID=A0ABQ8TMR3_PERAM|nr:hypothetical protein ANN_09170 [Periplaneta americana]